MWKLDGSSTVFFFFFLRDWSKLQIQRTAKRNRPTKDKRQETGDKTKTGAPTNAHSGELNTKAKGDPPPDPTPPHALLHQKNGEGIKKEKSKTRTK